MRHSDNRGRSHDRRHRDDWERIVSLSKPGLYESNYLKANSPDGRRGLWIKHNLLSGHPGRAELWVILFERDAAPVVARRDVPWDQVVASDQALAFDAGGVHLRPDRATGQIADIQWDLHLSGGLPPLFHLADDRLYTGGFPKKKLLTPAPNLHFAGRVQVGGHAWEIADWVGLRGHNWGTEHAYSYAYGNCNLWDDGATDRAVDGFTARIKLGPLRSPWLSSVVGHAPDVDITSPRRWLGAGAVSPVEWTLRWKRARLRMTADPSLYAGLRYAQPGGGEACCYNTKFAAVSWDIAGQRHTSRCGELEVLFASPLPGIPLHPTPDWDAGAGDYRS